METNVDAQRKIRAATLFNVDVSHAAQDIELKQQMWKLERMKNKELRVWWNVATLKQYVEKR